jgi:outer membrane protein OmpA-like peptidoglycan-associated protein
MSRFKFNPHTLVPVSLLIALAGPAQSQVAQTQQPVVFHVDVVSRTTKAVNYHHRQGSTTLTLAGSALAPRAKGEVRVDSKTGATKVDASIERLPPASSLAEGYLTYVLWAITPEGRPENMGELMLEGDHARVQAATELQTFGMIVTAEPYYAVTQPSDFIVAEAIVNQDTAGTIMPIETKYELVARGGYLQQLQPADRVRLREAKHIPLDLMEARQAMAVATAAGGDRYATDTMAKARIDLGNAEAFLQSNQDRKRIQTLARHVTQLAEDARLISVRKADDEALAFERSEHERRAAELTRNAENEAERRRNADQQASVAQQQASLAQQQAADARRATEQVQAQSAAALADKDRQLAIEAERARTAAAQAELERTKQRLLEQEAATARLNAQASDQRNRELEDQARAAREAAQRAEDERVKMRAELSRQLNLVLETRETARGLIVNMSDVLFDTGQHTLKPGAREKLAKIAGIILAHPGLTIQVEGHTDSTGGPAINQPLSERRASSVRSYLVVQGVNPDSVTSHGFGETKPVADNSTAAGRQANRRVELVVSGPLLSNPNASSNGGR